LTNKPPAQRRQLGIWGIENWPWEKWAPVVARYFAIITEMDAHIGRLLDRLGQLGRLDDTLVIYTTDHGDFCGGHGMMDKHFSMYDDILRVPLLMRWPGRLPAGLACDGFVSHELDIARTLLEIAGIEPPATFCGHDLVTLANGRLASRPDIFAQYFGTESGLYSQRMVRDRRFKYVFNPTAFDEFYDLAADPGEITNRIDDPASRDEIARLRRRMADWMREVRDPLLNNWTRPHLLGEPNIAARSGLC
jgi:arylsulfatase A-like enzyme